MFVRMKSDTDHFDSKEYEMLLSRFSFGTYKKTLYFMYSNKVKER